MVKHIHPTKVHKRVDLTTTKAVLNLLVNLLFDKEIYIVFGQG